jgi:hypothetical protein
MNAKNDVVLNRLVLIELDPKNASRKFKTARFAREAVKIIEESKSNKSMRESS